MPTQRRGPTGIIGWWCAVCGWAIHRVPGGHGSTWVHTATMTVWGDGPEPGGAEAMSDPNEIELDAHALTLAHAAVEDILIEMRDARLSVLGPANGFVVR